MEALRMEIRSDVQEWTLSDLKCGALRNGWPNGWLGKGLQPDISGFRRKTKASGLRDVTSVTQGVEYFFSLFTANRHASITHYIECLYNSEGLLDELYSLPFLHGDRPSSVKMLRGLKHLTKYLRTAQHLYFALMRSSAPPMCNGHHKVLQLSSNMCRNLATSCVLLARPL